jgi:hypothetical protein
MRDWGGEMQDRGVASPRHARPPEPSWPTVIATTVRLWLERHGVTGRRAVLLRRLLALTAVLVVGLVAVVVTDAVVHRGPTSAAVVPRKTSPAVTAAAAAELRVAAATRGQAAGWIAHQVSGDAIVACDPAMCAALEASGLPGSRLLMLGTATGDPLGSDVVVATPAVRNEFGARLAGVYAPLVIASFGTGAGRVDVRAIAPDGAAAYESSLAADRGARIAAGRQLLRNRRIQVSAAARAALAGGDVDSRLLVALAALAAEQPLQIVAFGDPSPGANVAVPLRSAEIAPAQAPARHSAALGSMLSFLNAQRPPYQPAQAGIAGNSLLDVEFAAPSPLGLLNGP